MTNYAEWQNDMIACYHIARIKEEAKALQRTGILATVAEADISTALDQLELRLTEIETRLRSRWNLPVEKDVAP